MKKLLFIILSLCLTMCDFAEISEENHALLSQSESILSSFIQEENLGTINLILTNNFEEDIFIREVDIPIGEFEKDSFKIEHKGNILSYIGKLFSFIPDEIRWIKLSPGEELKLNVYLPNMYNFPESNIYPTYFSTNIKIKFNDNFTETIKTLSNTINLTVDEKNLSINRIASVKSCSSNEKSLLNRGKNLSLNKVNNVNNYLAQKKADNYYVKWFGRYSSSRFDGIVSGFKKMVPSHKKNWTYSCETKANGGCNGWAAFVYKHIPEQTWVCMDYYKRASDDNRGELMTHEASHWNVNFSSDDYVYGKTKSINLAKNSPDKAVDCADNIAFYTWDIPKAGNPPVDPPVNPPANSPVIVYQHDNYNGWGIGLKVDRYNINKMVGLGVVNDAVSSIKVKSGYKAIIYEHKDFKGISHIITKNMSSLRTLNFNDKLSSIKVKKVDDTEPPVEPPVEPPSLKDSLLVDQSMKPKDGLVSGSGKYKFWLQGDGNLVLRDAEAGGKVVWASGSANKGGVKLILQRDGNLVLYTASHKAVWASGTDGRNVSKFQVLNTGKVVIKNTNGNIIWSRPKTTNPDPPVDPPDNTDSWKFVVGGDTRSNDSAHRSVLRAVKNNTPDYKLYLNSGDVVNTGTSSGDWNTFRNAVNAVLGSNWQTKYLACPGNHDMVRKGGLSNWNKYLSVQSRYRDKGRNFSYTYKNATFIVLDADIDKDSQASWIQSTMNNVKTTWVFAMWHYPNYYSQWIKALGKFDGVFFGHEHKYRRENKGSYFGIVVGTGGAPLGSGNVYGYLECKVNGNKMTVKYIKASNGSVLDSKMYTANSK